MGEVVSVIGGGLGGLVAAISCAESGRQVRVYEAHGSLGGRARATASPFVANFGPHALYKGRSNWQWLRERDLLPPMLKPSLRGLRYRYRGKLRRTAPAALARVLTMARSDAPLDQDFRSWASSRCGESTASLLCCWASAFTFDHHPGRLSAAFVWERFRSIYQPPTSATFAVAGTSSSIASPAGRETSASSSAWVTDLSSCLPRGPEGSRRG